MNPLLQRFPILQHLSPKLVGSAGSFFLTAGLSTLAWVQWKKRAQEARLVKQRPKRLVVITGCDSGLGLTMAYWAGKKGYQVLAGCYSEESEGAKFLQKEFQDERNPLLRIIGIDVTDKISLKNFREKCENLLIESKGETSMYHVPLTVQMKYYM
jgi:hypothetical protein